MKRSIKQIWSDNATDWPALRDNKTSNVWLILLSCGHYVTRYTPSCYITTRPWCAKCNSGSGG